jgi:hypothetical protein
MRRFLVFLALLAALALPVSLAAATPADGTLSVKRGRGTVVLKLKGTVIGRFKKGRVQIWDFRPFDDNVPHITGCKPRRPTLNLTVCTGRNVGFRVDERRYKVVVRGNGISISAVARGAVVVDGGGENGLPDGVMSIDDAAYQSLPDFATTFYLGTSRTVR